MQHHECCHEVVRVLLNDDDSWKGCLPLRAASRQRGRRRALRTSNDFSSETCVA